MVGLGVFVAFSLSIGATTAGASGGGDGCNPGRTDNYLTYNFDGVTQSSPSDSGGLQADILNYSPFVYNTSGDDTSEWVMLVSTSTYNYTQIGWDEAVGSARYTFVEWGLNNGNGGFADEYFTADSINSVSDYKDNWDPSSEYYHFYDGGTLKWTEGLAWSSPNQAQIYNETHTQASQEPGGSSNENYMYGGEFYYPSGGSGSWHTLAADTYSSAPSWAKESPTSGPTSSYDTWDSACTY